MSEDYKNDIVAWKERGRVDKKLWREQIAQRMAEIAKIADIKKRYQLKIEIGISDHDLNVELKSRYFLTQRLLLSVKDNPQGDNIKKQIRLDYYQKRAEMYEKHLLKGSLALGRLQQQILSQRDAFVRQKLMKNNQER